MAFTITDLLNQLDGQGVFSYVLPFLIIFSVVFAILQKTKVFGDPTTQNNVKGINAIIAVAIGLLALLNDIVPTFFATLFPRFGVIIGIFVVVLILIGFFYTPGQDGKGGIPKWIGWVLLIVLIVWVLNEWNYMGSSGFWGYGSFYTFIQDYLWGILLLGGVGYLIYLMTK